MRRGLGRALIVALSLPLIAGCGAEKVGSVVTGEVTFQGKPLSQGSIEFSPAAGQPTMSGGEIKDGKYSLPPESGLAPGKYNVRISATEGGVSTTEMPGEAKPAKQLISEEYNTKTKLTAEVTESGENKFDFTIP